MIDPCTRPRVLDLSKDPKVIKSDNSFVQLIPEEFLKVFINKISYLDITHSINAISIQLTVLELNCLKGNLKFFFSSKTWTSLGFNCHKMALFKNYIVLL